MLYTLHLYIIFQLYLNKTGGNFINYKKKKIPFMSSRTISSRLQSQQSEQSFQHFSHIMSLLCSELSSGSPSFSEQKPTDHMYLATTSDTFPAAYTPPASPLCLLSTQAQCCLRAFALAKPSVWNALPLDIPRDNFVTSLKFLF